MQKEQELAQLAAGLAAERKARDTVLLEVGKITYLADYFLICTATSRQHVKALSDFLREKLKEAGAELQHIEGYREGRWVLMDYASLIIHIFQPAEREFYNLERLWSDALPKEEQQVTEKTVVD